MQKKICVMGAGSWGTALAILLAGNGHEVRIWGFDQEEVNIINENRENTLKLPNVKLPESIICTNDFSEAIKGAEVILMVVPSQTVRANSRLLAKYVNNNPIIVLCSKGIEQETSLCLTQVIEEELPNTKIVVLSGPSHAEEVGRGIPTVVAAASEDIETAKEVQDIFMSENFRVYTNLDVIGVEIGSALKNVIALCAGISDGLGYGDNTKAALMTRGIAEITRLGLAMGCKSETFYGLTGVGDLIVTCTSMHSRNRKAGILIGEGRTVEEAVKQVGMVVEGISTAKAARILAEKYDVSMPICDEAYKVLFEGKEPKQAVMDLMIRDKKHEKVG